MPRPLTMLLAALLLTPAALAQPATTAPAEPAATTAPGRMPTLPMAALSGPKLTQETKLRYLLRQLDLNVEQRRFARDLLAELFPREGESAPFSIDLVQSIFRELQEATEQGDEQRVKQLEAELREIGRSYEREPEFLANLEPILTDEQKAALRAARARLERNPGGSVRPIDLWRLARGLKLTKAQRARLDEVHRAFREKMRGIRSPGDEVRFQMINGLVELIKAELTPEQQREFELGIRRLRPDLAWKQLKPRLPQTRPAMGDKRP